MAYQVLLKSGLSQKEAEIYEALLSIGESPIADLLHKTQDHPQIVYRALDKLVSLGLVLVSYRRHRKYVRAEDPHILEKLQEKKLNEIREGIPDLLALQKGTQDAVVRVNKGNEAVRSMRSTQLEVLNEGDSLLIIGASGDRYYEIMGDLHAEVERKRIKKGVTRKLISNENQRENLEQDKLRSLTEFRYLPQDQSVPSSTAIYGNKISITTWEGDPIVIEIESKAVADSYRQYFEGLWVIAKQ